VTRTLRGKVRGRTIELDEDPGEADGQTVEIQINPSVAKKYDVGGNATGLTRGFLRSSLQMTVPQLTLRHA